jgi:hypothetical protein
VIVLLVVLDWEPRWIVHSHITPKAEEDAGSFVRQEFRVRSAERQ